ncbi:LOW QUALITY PROTEIN: proline-rich transmembrane protein 3 [Pelodiscus sinensis]|uniref:LOW QUALITY PROTEIN: proline-rich transmembrane protein 3 n=1 Tax=Pelodiscus sinensis TaxID=13735 RepID=UPI003F6CF34A
MAWKIFLSPGEEQGQAPMAAAARLLAWSLLLVPARLPASPVSVPYSSEPHTRLPAARAPVGPGWAPELAGWSSSKEALWPRQALPGLSPEAPAVSGESLVFSGAGEPDHGPWHGSWGALLQPGTPSAAVSHDSGTPPSPAGSSALPPPLWPLLLGAEAPLQTLEGAPAPGPADTGDHGGPSSAAGTFREHMGLSLGGWPFAPLPGSTGGATAGRGAQSLLAPGWTLRTGGSPGVLALESRSLQPASPGPARPLGVEGALGLAGQDSRGSAGTPHPRPTVSTIALATRPGAAPRAAAEGPGPESQEGRPGSWALPGDPLEHAWVEGQAPHAQGYSLPAGGAASLLPLPAMPTGAGASVAGGWAGLAPALLSAGPPALPAQGSPAWTEVLSAPQRSTQRALAGTATQLLGTAAPGEEQGPEQPHTWPGTWPAAAPSHPGAAAEELGPPQRVRGAVDPGMPVNATSTATSVPRPTPPATRHPGAAGTRPSGPPRPPPATPRRGLVRVSTQRALPRPALPEPGPSLPCPPGSRPCSLLQPNRTLLRWADLQRRLSLAWGMHVYGTSSLFLLLSLLCAASLLCLPGRGLPHLPCRLAALALLLGAGLLRATFLLADPYGSRARLPAPAVRLLYNAPFPLLLSAFALLLLLLRGARRQRLRLLAALAALHSALLLGADLLSPPLSPLLGVGLHLLSCACGAALMLAPPAAYWQLRQAQRGCEAPPELHGLGPCARVLLGCSAPGLLCCGLQGYGALWLGGVLGPPGEFSWPWWFVQLWFRLGELLLSFALCFVASYPLCQRCGAAGHTCWAKLLRYLCAHRKAEAPEPPHGCYAWANGAPEQAASHLRTPPEQLHLRALKGKGRRVPGTSAGGYPSSLGRPGASPQHPSVAASGHSHTSLGGEKASVPSLAELEFRPPSPINLSRSIDQALFREHLVRDSVFLRCSLQCSRRPDSCSSLRRSSLLAPMAEPLLPAKAWPRRSSDPDCLARYSSLSDLPSLRPRGLPSEPRTEGTISGSSLDSFSRGSMKISWNPWRHGLSSLESLPLEETPSRAPLLPSEAPAGEAGDSEREARRSFLALSKQVDSRSLSSDTIEL